MEVLLSTIFKSQEFLGTKCPKQVLTLWEAEFAARTVSGAGELSKLSVHVHFICILGKNGARKRVVIIEVFIRTQHSLKDTKILELKMQKISFTIAFIVLGCSLVYRKVLAPLRAEAALRTCWDWNMRRALCCTNPSTPSKTFLLREVQAFCRTSPNTKEANKTEKHETREILKTSDDLK